MHRRMSCFQSDLDPSALTELTRIITRSKISQCRLNLFTSGENFVSIKQRRFMQLAHSAFNKVSEGHVARYLLFCKVGGKNLPNE